jgi:hypothetical protein
VEHRRPVDVRVLDAFAVCWTILWVVVGFLVFHEVRGLSSLSDTLVQTGHALEAAAGVPLVGGRIGDLARSAVASGESSRGDVRNLAILLWIAVAAAPTTPLLVLYGLVRGRLTGGG